MCVAYPGQVLEVVDGMAIVDERGRSLRASTAAVPQTRAGDWVVVSAGMVLQIMAAEEARIIREMLDEALGLEGDDAGDGRSATGGPGQ